MSPSGKAPDFDSGIRRFESCHPSHDPLAQLAEQLPFKQWVWSSNLQRVTTSSRTAYRSRRLFFKKSSLTHSVAPPLQTEPAALGFGLVLAANLKAAASIVLRCYKTILYKPLFLRSWLCGNSLYETEIGRIPKIERLSRMAEPFGFFISCFRR